MQVKLSYTVDEEEIHEEASKLLGLKSAAMQRLIGLFNNIQEGLRPPEDEAVNPSKIEDLIDEFRQTLMEIDLRLVEIRSIVVSYEEFKRRPPEPADAHVYPPDPGGDPQKPGGDWMDQLPEKE